MCNNTLSLCNQKDVRSLASQFVGYLYYSSINIIYYFYIFISISQPAIMCVYVMTISRYILWPDAPT